jgi:glycosyltransferase involved in cell wall biosynthesis
MRILFCNKYNYPFSGTEVYLFELMELMRSHGHEVALFSMADPRGQPTSYDHHFVPHLDFKAQGSIWQRSRRALHAIYSTDARRRIRAMVEEFRPEIAHLRNIYHHLSPSILWELRAQNIPVVYHLNDFKLLCPSYNLVCNGKACEACKGGEFFHMLRAKCYPGLGASLALTAEAYIHKWCGTYPKCVDRFLAPSQFVRDKFVEHGWDQNKFEVLQHFQKVPPVIAPGAPDSPVLYFGRLSKEKGVDDLIRAMKAVPNMRLVIAGEGPQRGELRELGAKLGLNNVEFVGQVQAPELDELIAASRFTVLPSHAYETFGKTILESYAVGRAVVASDMGSRSELVRHGVTGILYPPGDVDRLAAAMMQLRSHPELAEKMGRAGWEMAQSLNTPEEHYQKMLSLYRRVIAARTAPRRKVVATTQAPPWRGFCHVASVPSRPLPGSTKPRLRVAFIGGRGVISKYSGIEAYYEAVGERLAAAGHQVTVYCRKYFTPPVAEYNGMRLLRLPTIRSKHLETLLHTILSTAHVITHKCDVVHYHTLGPALFSFIPRLMGKRTVVTVQGLDWQRKKWGRLASAVLRLGESASVRFPNKTMVVSQALREHYRKQHGVEALYLPNGGTLRSRSQPKKILDWGLQPGNYILFLGRLSPEKNCHLLVEAYEHLNTHVKLVLAGAASYSDDYSGELRAHANANDRIKILDWVSGPVLDELLTNAMLFVLPSDLEGLSLALLDAMGAGLCVLTSDIPENREVVDGAGFTFHSGNVTDLCDKLRLLIANPALRQAAGRAARDRIRENYQWTEVAEGIERAYLELIGWDTSRPATKKPSASVTGPVLEPAKMSVRRAG